MLKSVRCHRGTFYDRLLLNLFKLADIISFLPISVYAKTYQNDVVRIRVSDLLLPEVVDGELGHLVAEFVVGRVLDRHRRGELHAPDNGVTNLLNCSVTAFIMASFLSFFLHLPGNLNTRETWKGYT